MSGKREDFLLHMYDAFWDNVSRAENGAWSLVAVYSALIAGVGLAEPVITSVGAAFILIVFGYIGSCLSASTNIWFRRNLTLIGRIERNFLNATDYGSLLPVGYQKSRRLWTMEHWTVLVVAYPGVSLIVSLILLSSTDLQKVVPLIGLPVNVLMWLTVLLGFTFTLVYVIIQDCNYRSFLRQTST